MLTIDLAELLSIMVRLCIFLVLILVAFACGFFVGKNEGKVEGRIEQMNDNAVVRTRKYNTEERMVNNIVSQKFKYRRVSKKYENN
jgi:hypothetical protein